jgi:phage terminase large subunit-like protein
MSRCEASAVAIEELAGEQTRRRLRRSHSVGPIIFLQPRCDLVPQFSRDDCFVQPWMRISLMDDLPNIDAIVQEMIVDRPARFETIFQSWDTANKPTELSDYSVCTTWGVKEKHAYLLHVIRKRLGYPELKRAVLEQLEAFGPETVLIEDRASGTQLIQDLVSEGMHAIKKYEPTMDKIMRMHSVTSTIENGSVHLPD